MIPESGLSIVAALGRTTEANMLLFGFLGLGIMASLAITSNKWSMRTLGRSWKQLHWLTYAVAIFIVLHMLLLGEGIGFAIIYSLLLAIRIPIIRRTIVDWRQKRTSVRATANGVHA